MPRGPPIDIWNLACLDLFEGTHLFDDVFNGKGHHDPFRHLALIYSLIGPPPSKFVERSETTEQCFDSNGKWIADEHAHIPPNKLDDMETRLHGEDKRLFLQFIRSMLKWLPEERKTAKELLQDPWLNM
ncbi:MAG: hypothetical protein M1822_002417 [Bathelium mastoideum]|nr:MAG: hypothetical protein M1822_002417 [Bathelium mastoideum]